MIYKGICFFDKEGMEGWGAKWKKRSVLFFLNGDSVFLENTENVTLQRTSNLLDKSMQGEIS